MSRRHAHIGRPGFLLMEVLVGLAVFVAFISGVGYTLLYGQSNTIMFGDRVRAVQFTERAIEASRAIRDDAFASVTTGTHGVWVDLTGQWAFSGSSVNSSGGYLTSVIVSPVASDWVRLYARTTWKHGYNRSGSVVVTSEITDWRAAKNIGNWGSISEQGSVGVGGAPLFNDLAIYSGSYVFVTSSAEKGLYVFNTSNLSSPSHINTSFDLGTDAYDLAIHGKTLYVATDSPSQEIRAYNIANPATFGAPELIATYNAQGAARIRSLAVQGDMLYAGATESSGGGEEEFYALYIGTGGITKIGSVNDDTSTFDMMALSGTAAYLASSDNGSELRVIDIETASTPQVLGGYNLANSQDGLSIMVSGTSALLGKQKDSSSQEVVLFDVTGHPLPVPPPGPWYHEGSGSITGIAADPTRCYGFLSALSGHKALQVFNMQNKNTLAELTTYDSVSGLGRGLLYDLVRDRVMLITDATLLIFSPGASTGACP